MKSAYISIGSNLGDRMGYIKKALHLINVQEKVQLTRVSSFYETEPVGYLDQAKFINGVFSLETAHSPHALLQILQGIETSLERKRTVRWGPRTMDLDILLFSNIVLQDSVLTVPHPRLVERAFVLVPLAEIAPSLLHPVTGKTISQHLEELGGLGESSYSVVRSQESVEGLGESS